MMIQLKGIPFDANSSFLKGPAFAPQRIRLMDQEGSANAFAESGLEIKEGVVYEDCGDIKFEDSNPENAFHLIQEEVRSILSKEDKAIFFGGDHSISFPIIDIFAERYKNLTVLHLDAHADLYEDFDGNPYSHASPFARLLEGGKLSGLTQVGIRTFNTHQKEQARKYGVEVIEMKNFYQNNTGLDFIKKLKAPLYISLDLDVLDPAFAPGVSHHEPGGMSTRALINLLQQIPVEIVGADIVEYNPIRDVNNMTAMVAYKLFKELVAKMDVK